MDNLKNIDNALNNSIAQSTEAPAPRNDSATPTLQTAEIAPEAAANVRNIIVDLLKNGSVLYDLNSEQYRLLRSHENESLIRSILRNLNIELVIAPEGGLAYIKNIDRTVPDDLSPDGIPAISDDETEQDDNQNDDKYLINRANLSAYKSVLLIILRKFYQERFTKGETEIVIDIDFLQNLIMPYIPVNASESRDLKKLRGALSDFTEYNIVKKLRSEDDDRYQILPLIRYVVDANKLEELLEEYKVINEGGNSGSGSRRASGRTKAATGSNAKSESQESDLLF